MALQLSNSLANAISSSLQNPNIKYQEKSSLDDRDRMLQQKAVEEQIAASRDSRNLARQSAAASEKLNFENSLLNRAKLPQESQRLAIEHMKALTNVAQLDDQKAKEQSSVLAKYGVMAFQNPKIAGQLREDFKQRFGYDPGDLTQKSNALAAAAADEAFSKGIAKQAADALDPEMARKREATRLQQIGQSLRVVDAIDRAFTIMEKAPKTSTGFLSDFLKQVGGTAAKDLETTLATIQAAEAFGALQEMRSNSPTGGALGQVSERELKLLQSAYALANQSDSPESIQRNLALLKNRYLDVIYGEGNGPERTKIDGKLPLGVQSTVAQEQFNESNLKHGIEVKQGPDSKLYKINHNTKMVEAFDGVEYYKQFISKVGRE